MSEPWHQWFTGQALSSYVGRQVVTGSAETVVLFEPATAAL